MKKENLVFALVGVIVGIILGTMIGSYSLPKQTVSVQPEPVVTQPEQQNQNADQKLPEGHPPIDDTAMRSELAQQLAVLQTDPQNQQAIVAVANLNFDMKNFKEAAIYYEKAILKDSKNTNLITDLGTSYFYSDNPDKALELYNRSLSIDPKHAQTLMNLGVVKMMSGDKKGAADAWEKLISYHPDLEQTAELKATVQKLRAES